MASLSPGTNLTSLRNGIQGRFGVNVSGSPKKEIESAVQMISSNRLPLPPLIFSSDKTMLIDPSVGLTAGDYRLLFSASSTKLQLKRVARKLKIVVTEQFSKETLKEAITKHLISVQAMEPIQISRKKTGKRTIPENFRAFENRANSGNNGNRVNSENTGNFGNRVNSENTENIGNRGNSGNIDNRVNSGNLGNRGNSGNIGNRGNSGNNTSRRNTSGLGGLGGLKIPNVSSSKQKYVELPSLNIPNLQLPNRNIRNTNQKSKGGFFSMFSGGKKDATGGNAGSRGGVTGGNAGSRGGVTSGNAGSGGGVTSGNSGNGGKKGGFFSKIFGGRTSTTANKSTPSIKNIPAVSGVPKNYTKAYMNYHKLSELNQNRIIMLQSKYEKNKELIQKQNRIEPRSFFLGGKRSTTFLKPENFNKINARLKSKNKPPTSVKDAIKKLYDMRDENHIEQVSKVYEKLSKNPNLVITSQDFNDQLLTDMYNKNKNAIIMTYNLALGDKKKNKIYNEQLFKVMKYIFVDKIIDRLKKGGIKEPGQTIHLYIEYLKDGSVSNTKLINMSLYNRHIGRTSGANGGRGGNSAPGARRANGGQGGNSAPGASRANGGQGGNSTNGANGGRGGNGAPGANGGRGGNGARGANGGRGGNGARGANGGRGGNGANGANGGRGGNSTNGANGGRGRNGENEFELSNNESQTTPNGANGRKFKRD